MKRGRFLPGVLAMLLLSGCALPKNHAPGDWSRTASVVVDYPAAVANGSDRAMQQALSRYFFGIGILADGGRLTFDDAAYAALVSRVMAGDEAAGRATSRLGALLAVARDQNPRFPDSKVGSETLPMPDDPQMPQDVRLEDTVRESDVTVQLLLTMLAANIAQFDVEPTALAIARANYSQVLARIGEGHALLTQRANHVDQEETRRSMRTEDERLQHAAALLPLATSPSAGSLR